VKSPVFAILVSPCLTVKVSVFGSKESHFGPYVILALIANPPTLKVDGSVKLNASAILNSKLVRGSVKFGGVVESTGGGVFVMFTVIVWFCLNV
jgi:hypothetical protein